MYTANITKTFPLILTLKIWQEHATKLYFKIIIMFSSLAHGLELSTVLADRNIKSFHLIN